MEERRILSPKELQDAVASRISAAGGRVDYVEVGCALCLPQKYSAVDLGSS